MPQQMGEMEWGKCEDRAGRERGQRAAARAEQPSRQQPGAQSAHHKTEDHHGVVGRQQAPGDLNRQDRHTVERVQGVKKQPDSRGVIEQVGEEGGRLFFQQRHLHPPKVPVVLPAVEAIARNRNGELPDEREGEDQSRQKITEKRQQGAKPMRQATTPLVVELRP